MSNLTIDQRLEQIQNASKNIEVDFLIENSSMDNPELVNTLFVVKSVLDYPNVILRMGSDNNTSVKLIAKIALLNALKSVPKHALAILLSMEQMEKVVDKYIENV